MDLSYDAFAHPGCYGHSESLFPFASVQTVNASEADVIHLHWINGDFLSIGQLGAIRKPVVWTLHDNWAYCGNEFYTEKFRYRDGYTRDTRPAGETGPDFARLVWQYKKRKWRNFHPVFVSPSRWNADRLTESMLFRNVPCEVIRNPLNLDIFSPGDRASAQKKFGLDPACITVLFGAERINNPLKGSDLLAAALKLLPRRIPAERLQLLCFGAGKPEINSPYPMIHAGCLNGDEAMAELYRAADILICPSRMDNYPGVCTEAMACGVPVAAFRIGGLPEIVTDPDSLAEPFHPESLAQAIVHTIRKRRELSAEARHYAEEHCRMEKIGAAYCRIYAEAVRQFSTG